MCCSVSHPYTSLHCRDYVNPYIPVAPQGIDPSLAVGITNPGGPNPMEGNVLLCSVSACTEQTRTRGLIFLPPYASTVLCLGIHDDITLPPCSKTLPVHAAFYSEQLLRPTTLSPASNCVGANPVHTSQLTANSGTDRILFRHCELIIAKTACNCLSNVPQSVHSCMSQWKHSRKRHVLWLQIENQAYPVNVEALHTVFSPYGAVQKIACFEKNNTWQVCRSPQHCLPAHWQFATGVKNNISVLSKPDLHASEGKHSCVIVSVQHIILSSLSLRWHLVSFACLKSHQSQKLEHTACVYTHVHKHSRPPTLCVSTLAEGLGDCVTTHMCCAGSHTVP